MFGYTGRILRANLTEGKTREEKLTEELCKDYLGGRGLAAYFLFNELQAGIDPLGADNKLIFAVGPLEGTMVAGCSRHGIFAKSPLTGIWGESNAAGWFGNAMKASGFDMVIVEGMSADPVYLSIEEGHAQIRDGAHIWGKTTGETEDTIRNEIGNKNVRAACIGPAGENLVKYACVISDKHRAAGRTGMGAVMGSKKLKAVAAYGNEKTPVADQEELKRLRKIIAEKASNVGKNTGLTEHGTSVFLGGLNGAAILPTHNFHRSASEHADSISGQTMTEKMKKSTIGCPGCTLRCIKSVEVKTGPFAPVLPEYGGPEYESLAAFGSLCDNYDLESIAKACMLCNMYGLDTISTGVSIAFAMECYDEGMISKADTNNMDITWGNSRAIVELVEKIAKKEGFGALLSDGVRKASEVIGKNSGINAMHVKGMELPLHEPRGRKGLGLSYATSNRGACHLQAVPDTSFEKENAAPELGITKAISRYDTSQTKVDYIVKTQNKRAVVDSAIMCKYVLMGLNFVEVKDLANATTGWGITVETLLEQGDRIIDLCRAFNVREGITRKDDTLPLRFEEALSEGLTEGQTLDRKTLDRMLDDFYNFRGWSIESGIPTRNKLNERNLQFAADELGKLGKL